MTFDVSFNPPQFNSDEYDPVKMRQFVEEIERLHAVLIASTGDLTFNGNLNGNVTIVTTTSYTASAEYVILVDDDTAAATVTITLPPASAALTIYHIKKLGTTASVIVDGDGTDTIDGSLTAVLTIQYESIKLISDGTNWNII